MRNPKRIAFAALALLLTSGCALTSKSDSVILRYFTPESAASPAPAARTNGADGTMQLRLGRFTSSSYLREKIAFRDAVHEVGFYEELRWTEKPESYLRRATVHVLFEERGIRQLLSGVGPTLDVELTAFEELVAQKSARVTVNWMLRDEDAVLIQDTLTVERPIAHGPEDAKGSAVATALADALGFAVTTMSTRVAAELEKTKRPETDAVRLDGPGSHPQPAGAVAHP